MVLRILTDTNYIDIEPIDISEQDILKAIDESNAVAMKLKDGTTFIMNTINIVGIKIISKEVIPPIQDENGTL